MLQADIFIFVASPKFSSDRLHMTCEVPEGLTGDHIGAANYLDIPALYPVLVHIESWTNANVYFCVVERHLRFFEALVSQVHPIVSSFKASQEKNPQ